jgi:hypothetical protein
MNKEQNTYNTQSQQLNIADVKCRFILIITDIIQLLTLSTI